MKKLLYILFSLWSYSASAQLTDPQLITETNTQFPATSSNSVTNAKLNAFLKKLIPAKVNVNNAGSGGGASAWNPYYQADSSYKPNDIVFDQGTSSIYYATDTVPLSTPPPNDNYWAVLIGQQDLSAYLLTEDFTPTLLNTVEDAATPFISNVWSLSGGKANVRSYLDTTNLLRSVVKTSGLNLVDSSFQLRYLKQFPGGDNYFRWNLSYDYLGDRIDLTRDSRNFDTGTLGTTTGGFQSLGGTTSIYHGREEGGLTRSSSVDVSAFDGVTIRGTRGYSSVVQQLRNSEYVGGSAGPNDYIQKRYVDSLFSISGGGGSADGSETKINAGTNVTVTGSGTIASPYVISAAGGGGSGPANTDALPEGTNNLYFTLSRARTALSSTATGLSYNNTTGVLSLAGGYFIPQTANLSGTNTGDETGATIKAKVEALTGANRINNSAFNNDAGYLTAGSIAQSQRQDFTGTGSQTAFTVSGTMNTDLLVVVAGVVANPATDYTRSGNTITFTTAPASGEFIRILYR